MAMTASRVETFVMGNKRCEIWTFTGSTDTGGTFVAGVTPDHCSIDGSTGATPPVAPTVKYVQSTRVVTVGYTSGSPTGRVLVIGH